MGLGSSDGLIRCISLSPSLALLTFLNNNNTNNNNVRGVDSLGVFPLFLKKVADIIAPKLSIIFVGLPVWDSFRNVGCLLM